VYTKKGGTRKRKKGANMQMVWKLVDFINRSVSAIGREITRDVVRPYRPEMHYMRGPGPAWRAKHDTPLSAK
jgi:hypothetical protein